MKQPVDKFSVIIPLYNKEGEIGRTIQSVLDQTIKDFEIIIIDDGSTDNSPEKVLDFKDPRIRLVSQVNQGASCARNEGIKKACNSLIAFLDADDAWSPNHLETLLRLRQNYPGAGICATAFEIVTENGKKIKSCLNGISSFPFEGLLTNYFRQSIHGSLFYTSSLTIPKKIFSDIGTFLTGESMGEDLDMWGRIALKYPVAFSSKTTACYYQNASNRACRNFDRTQVRISPFVKTAEKEIGAGRVPAAQLSDLKNYMASLQLIAAKASLMQGCSPATARKILKKIHPIDTKLKLSKTLCMIASYCPRTILRFLR